MNLIEIENIQGIRSRVVDDVKTHLHPPAKSLDTPTTTKTIITIIPIMPVK